MGLALAFVFCPETGAIGSDPVIATCERGTFCNPSYGVMRGRGGGEGGEASQHVRPGQYFILHICSLHINNLPAPLHSFFPSRLIS
jgi:hypothetical protein